MSQTPKTAHWLIYGDSGVGKTTSAATFPTPQLVFSWDPMGKEEPYKKHWLANGGRVETRVSDLGIDVEYVLDASDKLVCQIEHYIDDDPREPKVFTKFLARMDQFCRGEQAEWAGGTLIIDSATFMEIAARKLSQYRLLPLSKEPRQWFAASTDMLEESVMIRMGRLRMNVVVVCHIDEQRDDVSGEIIQNPKMPGRMRRTAPAAYSELYHQFVVRNDQGERVHLWQTRNDGRWNCSSQHNVPNPCTPEWAELWK